MIDLNREEGKQRSLSSIIVHFKNLSYGLLEIDFGKCDFTHKFATPAHLAQKFMSDPSFFEIFHQKYREAVNSGSPVDSTTDEPIPDGFDSEYASLLPDEKVAYARKKVNKKVNQLVYILYRNADEKEQKEARKKIHTKAKKRNGVPLKGFIGYEGWEKIYSWLLDRIAHAQDLKGTEDL